MESKEDAIMFWSLIIAVIMAMVVSYFCLIPYFGGGNANVGNNSRYAPKMELMIENTVITDTIYIIVPDQNAYNIGYFDGNSDAYYQFDSINNGFVDNN